VLSLRLGFLLGLLCATAGLVVLTSSSHARRSNGAAGPDGPPLDRATVRAYLGPDRPGEEAEHGGEETPQLCSVRGPGVPETLHMPAGWSRELVREGVPGVEALAVQEDGTLFLGGSRNRNRRRVVSRLEADGSLTDSRPHPEPDAIAVDHSGRVWLGAYDQVRRLGSMDGHSDPLWHQVRRGGNVDDLEVTGDGRRVFAALRDGRILEIEDGQEQIHAAGGGNTLIELDDEETLWILREERSGWWLYELDQDRPRTWVKLDSLVQGLVAVRDMDWGPGGTLSLLVEIRDPDPLKVVTWDPRQPREVSVWASGLAVPDGDMSGVAWDATSWCLYLSDPLAGRVYRSCLCTGVAG